MLKSRLFAAVLLAAVGMNASASAGFSSPYAAGTDHTAVALGVASPILTEGFYDFNNVDVAAGSFTDTISFALGHGFDLDHNTSSIFLKLSGTVRKNITSLSTQLYKGTVGGVHAAVGAAGADNVEVSLAGLTSGDYFLAISGVANGVKGGTYASSLNLTNIQTAAVPEPETYAMMLAGLGFVGSIARRKKAKAA